MNAIVSFFDELHTLKIDTFTKRIWRPLTGNSLGFNNGSRQRGVQSWIF